MPVPRVSGYPDFTTKVGADFPGSARIPILFAGKLLEKFYAKTCISQIATTDYVGEVKNVGDRVVIRTLPNVTIKDYKKGMTLELEYPDSPAIEFTINRAKYFNFAIDDIDVNQSDLSWIDKLADDAAKQLAIAIDTEVFATIYTKAHPDNQGTKAGAKTHMFNLGTATNPLVVNKSNVLDVIVDMGTVLDEQNVPDDDRWIVLPPVIMGLINKSDLKSAWFSGEDKALILKGGFTGHMLDRFNLYNSNLLYSFTNSDGKLCYYIPFGRKNALVYVAQINKTERYRPHNTFADAMKGLCVYDFDVINPKAFGVAVVTVE